MIEHINNVGEWRETSEIPKEAELVMTDKVYVYYLLKYDKLSEVVLYRRPLSIEHKCNCDKCGYKGEKEQ